VSHEDYRENRPQRRIIGPKKENYTMSSVIICIVHLIVRVIDSRRMRWRSVARMEKMRHAYIILVGKPQKKVLLDIGLDVRI
jgi:hypothetical protein